MGHKVGFLSCVDMQVMLEIMFKGYLYKWFWIIVYYGFFVGKVFQVEGIWIRFRKMGKWI